MKKFLIVFLFIFLVSITFSYAATGDAVDAHGVSLTAGDGLVYYRGVNVTVRNVNGITLMNVTLQSGCGATQVTVRHTNGTYIGNAGVVSLIATFGNLTLPQGSYFILAGASGSSYAEKRSTSVSFPYLGSNIDYVQGVYQNTAGNFTDYGVTTAAIYNVISIGSRNATSLAPIFENPTPIDDYTTNTQEIINLSCSLGTVLLYFDQNTNPITKTTGTGQTSPYAYTTTMAAEGTYYYKGSCSNGGIETNGTIRTLNYDVSKPSFAINPTNSINFDNSSNITRIQDVNFNITFTDNIDLFGFEALIYNSSGALMWNFTDLSLSGSTSYVWLNTTKFSNFAVGRYSVNISVADSHTQNIIPPYSITETLRKLTFETDSENIIVIESYRNADWDIIKYEDRYRFKFSPYTTDAESKYKFKVYCNNYFYYIATSEYDGHFVCLNLDTFEGNWLDFEGTNAPVTVKEEGDRVYEVEVEFEGQEITFDSIGGLNTNSLEAYFNISSYYAINPKLYLSDTLIWNYSGDFGVNVTFSLDNTLFNNILDNECNCTGCTISNYNCRIPFIFTSENRGKIKTNITKFNYTYGIDNCSVFTYEIINFTHKNQLEGTNINATNAYDLLVTLPFSQSFSGIYSNVEVASICSPVNRTYYNHTITGEITLSSDNYGTQIYEYTTGNTLEGATPTSLYSLYLGALANTSTIVFTWRTNTFENVDGTMRIYTCDGAGNRNLVASNAIINGESYANIELINQPYSYEVIYNGIVYTDEDTYTKCHVETQETRLYILKIGTPTAPITGLYSIPCNITRTGNFSFNMVWGENPQSESTIIGCVYAYRQSVRGSSEVYSECSNISGISATVADSGFTYIVRGRLYQNGYSIGCNNELTFETADQQTNSFGFMGVLSIFFLVAGLILLFINEEPKWYPIMGVLGLIFAWILGILAFGWIAISSLVAFVVIIVVIGRHGKQQ